MDTDMSKNQQHKPTTWTLPRVEGFKDKHKHMINHGNKHEARIDASTQ